VKVSWVRSRAEWKWGARDGQHGVRQRSTRGVKARRAWACELVQSKQVRRLEGRARGLDGRTPSSVGDQLLGLGDGPMGPSPYVMYIYINARPTALANRIKRLSQGCACPTERTSHEAIASACPKATDPAWLSHFTVRSIIFYKASAIFWFGSVILLHHCYSAHPFLL
jgi:hypothetical protein